ncbi:MAG: energy transducer TonB [Bacteroidota bacterium]
MVRSQRELQTGWIVSLFFHIAVAVILFYSRFQQYIPEPQFVEMTWGDISSLQAPIPEIPSEQTAAKEEVQQADQTDNSVALPSRKYLDLPDEVISVKQNKKNVSADIPSNTGRSGKISAQEQRSNVVSSGLGARDNIAGKSTSTSNMKVATPFGVGNEAGGLGDNVAYAVQWAGGGNRKLLSGDAPAYPPNVNISAQIKLRVRVQPDGTVRSVTPAQKGDTRLENVTISKVKLWKFEPLLSAQPQIEQDCTITFNFTLK